MFGRILEVAIVAFLTLCLLAPVAWRAVRKVRGSGAHTSVPSAAERDEPRRRWAGWIGGVLLAIAIMNGLAYSVHTGKLGGSAYCGERVMGWHSVSADGLEYTEGNGPAPVRAEGRYYVSSHGKYTKVTEEQWRAVRSHGIAMHGTHVLGLVVGGALLAYSQRWWGSKTAEPGAAANGGACRLSQTCSSPGPRRC